MGHSYYKPKRPRHVPPTGIVFTAATAVAGKREGSTLSKQAAKGQLVRVGQGIYCLADVMPPSWLDALVVAVKAPSAVLSGPTALHLQGLLRWAPPAVFVSQVRGTAPPKAPYVPVRVRWVDDDVLSTDTQRLERNDVWVRVANPGRAAAELFADRHAIGLAMSAGVITDLCAAGVLDLRETLRHAHRLHCATEMKALLGSVYG